MPPLPSLRRLLHAACLLFLSCCAAAPAAGEPYLVAALAADAGAVVLSAPDGRLLRYRSGEALPQTPWRVAEVRADEVVFARPLPGRGGALNVGVRAGAAIDFAALDQRHAPPPAPPPLNQFRYTPLPKRLPRRSRKDAYHADTPPPPAAA